MNQLAKLKAAQPSADNQPTVATTIAAENRY
jgi:hypothetical protein